ncbi:MAG TPA: hypothetical protein VJG66_02370 [Patescibacteria group bacterium]|nr:hypothetical protein [Patescibacteria group bacterium]
MNNKIDIRNWKPQDGEKIFELEEKCWAPWLRMTADILSSIAGVFPEGQLLVEDENGLIRASLTTNRIEWPGKEKFPTWDEVAGEGIESGDYHLTYKKDGDTLVMMSMNVHPDFRGEGYPGLMLERLRNYSKQNEIKHIIGPFRPSDYGIFKLKQTDPGFSKYCEMKREDGMPVDGWLRNLYRNGMKKIKIQKKSMFVKVSKDEFEQFKVNYRPDLWKEIKKNTWECGEVGNWKLFADHAIYTEDNIWGEMPLV